MNKNYHQHASIKHMAFEAIGKFRMEIEHRQIFDLALEMKR